MKKVYESPDKGKTVYERDFGSDIRRLVVDAPQYMWGKDIAEEPITSEQTSLRQTSQGQ